MTLTVKKKGVFLVQDLMLLYASSTGNLHLKNETPNQDSVYVLEEEDHAIACLMDGCSSSEFSQVGSYLFSRALVNEISQQLRSGLSLIIIKERLMLTLIQLMAIHLKTLGFTKSSDIDQYINSTLLFTVLIVILVDGKVHLFSCGDSLVFLKTKDGEYLSHRENQDNVPTYPAYHLRSDSLRNPKTPLEFWNAELDLQDIEYLIIASDSFVDHQDLLSEFNNFKSSSAIKRRLNVLTAIDEILDDDASIIVIKPLEVESG